MCLQFTWSFLPSLKLGSLGMDNTVLGGVMKTLNCGPLFISAAAGHKVAKIRLTPTMNMHVA